MKPEDLQQVKTLVKKMLADALLEFKNKNMGFRNRRIVDTPTDANAAVSLKDLTNSFPSNGGTFNDGADLAFGTGAGTKIGTATNQKMAFYGQTPIVQQASSAGPVTAGPTYTATEQGMLNDCYSVLRNLGLLS